MQEGLDKRPDQRVTKAGVIGKKKGSIPPLGSVVGIR